MNIRTHLKFSMGRQILSNFKRAKLAPEDQKEKPESLVDSGFRYLLIENGELG